VERTTYLDSTIQFEVVASNMTLESHLADFVVTVEGSSDSQPIRVRTAIRKASSKTLLIRVIRNLKKLSRIVGSLPQRQGRAGATPVAKQ
jgi:hypothetical protein